MSGTVQLGQATVLNPLAMTGGSGSAYNPTANTGNGVGNYSVPASTVLGDAVVKNPAPTLANQGNITTSPLNNLQTAQNNGVGSPAYSAFQGLYDNEIGNLQNQYNSLGDYRNADVNNINTQYTPQANTLQAQHASGLANIDLAQKQLDTTRSQGLASLGNNLRTALNGYQNQIGVMGAGNSSAAPLLGYALSQQGNREMSNMNQNYALQQTGLNQQQNDLETNFKNSLDTLDAWKQSQLNQIAENYGKQQQALQSAIMNAQGSKAQYLAMYGQTALANQAISQMQNLEKQYSDQAGQLHSQFQNVYAPQQDLSKYTGQPTINAITPSQLQPLSFQANQATPDNTSAYASLTKRPDQAPTTPNFGY